jgi:hemoglobin/transferrin/lactoferrin receptor protein
VLDDDRLNLKLGAELHRTDTEGEVFTSRIVQDLGPQFGPGATFTLATEDFDADDEAERDRISVESFTTFGGGLADSLMARVYALAGSTDQHVLELVRTTRGGVPFGPVTSSLARRDGLFHFAQDILGGELQAKTGLGASGDRHLLTYGAAFSSERFDQLRDRDDTNASTGAVLPSSFAFPTRYFPESRVDELGVYLQDEIDPGSGRLRLVPGVRYDRSELDPDQDDDIFLAGNPGAATPEGAVDDAVSPRLGLVFGATDTWSVFAQYAHGFRTAPASEVNVGFTNYIAGYTTLPNPDLEPETNDNVEVGVRGAFAHGSLSLTLFDNRYQDFIELLTLGVDPGTGLLEFQSRNVGEARIRGAELSADARLGSFTLRGAAAWMEGEDRIAEKPLDSIPPPRLVAGATYRAEQRWRASVIASYLFAKGEDEVDATTGQFATPAALVIDATASVDLGSHFQLDGGLFNLLDETYWEWGDVQGVTDGSPVLDRYTSPGRSVAARLRWARPAPPRGRDPLDRARVGRARGVDP